jgi:hypothetical protein
VERAHPDPLSDKFLDAGTHLLRGLIRESNAENIKSWNAMFDQPSNAVCENARFSASCPGQNKQRPDRQPGNSFFLSAI